MNVEKLHNEETPDFDKNSTHLCSGDEIEFSDGIGKFMKTHVESINGQWYIKINFNRLNDSHTILLSNSKNNEWIKIDN